MIRSALIALAFATSELAMPPTSASGDDTMPQVWSVTFVNETAVIRASRQTDVRFVYSAITSLQKAGIEKFALRPQQFAPKTDESSITVSVDNGEAELTISRDIPYQRVVAIISVLAQNDVEKVKFSPPRS